MGGGWGPLRAVRLVATLAAGGVLHHQHGDPRMRGESDAQVSLLLCREPNCDGAMKAYDDASGVVWMCQACGTERAPDSP